MASGTSGWSFVHCCSRNAPSSTLSYVWRPETGSGIAEWFIVVSQVPSSRSRTLIGTGFLLFTPHRIARSRASALARNGVQIDGYL